MHHDENDRSLRNVCHIMSALAFVPANNALADFETFFETVSKAFIPIALYFEQILYIKGLPVRG